MPYTLHLTPRVTSLANTEMLFVIKTMAGSSVTEISGSLKVVDTVTAINEMPNTGNTLSDIAMAWVTRINAYFTSLGSTAIAVLSGDTIQLVFPEFSWIEWSYMAASEQWDGLSSYTLANFSFSSVLHQFTDFYATPNPAIGTDKLDYTSVGINNFIREYDFGYNYHILCLNSDELKNRFQIKFAEIADQMYAIIPENHTTGADWDDLFSPNTWTGYLNHDSDMDRYETTNNEREYIIYSGYGVSGSAPGISNGMVLVGYTRFHVPTVEKWTISSITAGADGTTATIATAITPMPGGGTPDVAVVLQVGTNGVNYAPIANGLAGLTPGVAVTVYVTDQFGGVRTMAFTPEPLPVPEPVYPNVTFSDRDQQTIIPVEVNNPIGTDLLRAILQITFPALSKTLTRSLPVSGAVQFDINNALWGELVGRMEGDAMSFFAFPTDPDAIAINRIDTHTLAFTLEEGYSYVDDNMDVQQVITTANAQDPQYAGWRCLYGGAARHLNSYLKSINSTLYAYFAGGALMRFLTWMPNDMPMHPRQPQRLWLFNFGKFAAGKVMAQITWRDGTQSAAINCADLPGDIALWEIAVGADELRLHNVDVAKTVASYNVWVQNADNVKVTETRSFVLDHNFYRRNDVLFFRNSLGVHETIWLHGIREDNDDMTRDESLRPMAAQSTYRGSLVNARATVSHTYKMNSGYIPKRLRHWTTDFLTARDVVMPIGLYMVPISITQTKADKGDDVDDLFFFSFNAKIAHLESHYSPFPEVPSPWGDFNNDFNQDYFI